MFPLLLVIVHPVDPLPPANKISPVELAPIEIVPLPFASKVKFSFAPEEIVDTAKPPPAAAAVTFKPVTLEPVFVSTCSAGVAATRPTVNASLAWFSVLIFPSPETPFATKANAEDTNCLRGDISPS